MKLKLFALHDQALEAFGNPMVYTTTGQAIRDFTDQVNQKDSQLNKHAAFFTLHYIGQYENTTGTFQPEPPQEVARAADLLA